MKKLKYLLLAFILPAMFLFSACGDGQLGAEAQADIGNPENYVVATAAQETAFTELINDEEAVVVKSYRITAETTTGGMTMDMNCIYNVSGETLELAMKVDASMQGMSQTVKCWVKDNNAYGEFLGETGDMLNQMIGSNKIKEPVDGDMLSDVIDSLDSLTLEFCVEEAKGLDLTDEGISLKVNTAEDVTRYEIARESEGVRIYFIFNDGVLTSAQLEMGTTVKVIIEAFDGEIEFPDFGGFVDMSNGFGY